MNWEEKMSETIKFKVLTDEEVKSIKDNSKRGTLIVLKTEKSKK